MSEEKAEREEPIAVYRERLFQVGRVMKLYPDRVEITARWMFGKTYRMIVKLETLRPGTTVLQVRQALFKRAIAIAALGVAGAVAFSRPGGERYSPWLIYGLYAIAVASGAVAMLTYQKIVFHRFAARTGNAGLDIASAGPDRDRFEEFVRKVEGRIRRQ